MCKTNNVRCSLMLLDKTNTCKIQESKYTVHNESHSETGKNRAVTVSDRHARTYIG